MTAASVPDYVIADHARLEMARRGLTEEMIGSVPRSPEQQLDVRPGRVLLQSRFTMGSPGKTYLLRVFVDVDRLPTEVVTAYRTSKISKYWRQKP